MSLHDSVMDAIFFINFELDLLLLLLFQHSKKYTLRSYSIQAELQFGCIKKSLLTRSFQIDSDRDVICRIDAP